MVIVVNSWLYRNHSINQSINQSVQCAYSRITSVSTSESLSLSLWMEAIKITTVSEGWRWTRSSKDLHAEIAGSQARQAQAKIQYGRTEQ